MDESSYGVIVKEDAIWNIFGDFNRVYFVQKENVHLWTLNDAFQKLYPCQTKVTFLLS